MLSNEISTEKSVKFLLKFLTVLFITSKYESVQKMVKIVEGLEVAPIV